MHHSLKLYSRYQEAILSYYILQAKGVRIPLLGNFIRLVAEAYGRNFHAAYLLTLEEASKILDASSKLLLGPCSCRKIFKKCNNPLDAEILIGLGAEIFKENRPGNYKEISRQEAREVLQACEERRLLHTLVKCRKDFYALCNCCPCCCVPLRLKKDYRIASAWVREDNILDILGGA